MSSCPDLRLDWCSYEAAKYAVEHWHYSRSMPAFKTARVGVWENGVFVGAILFGVGANSNIHSPFRLQRHEACELVRVALRDHRNAVSRMVAIAIRLLRRQSPGLRLIVSYADTAQDHYGGIYQAGGWIYTGLTSAGKLYLVRGKWVHHRQASSLLGSIKGVSSRMSSEKHRYLMPLDDDMKRRIAPLAKPYPKRPTRGTGETDSAPGSNRETGGASPTVPLLPEGDD